MAGHAGTVPMALRRDALTGAAECIVAIEELCRTDPDGLVGTVGYINAMPGATNVIPGKVSFTMDIRAPTDTHRRKAVADIVRRVESIAKTRALALQIDVTHENRTVPCAPWLKAQVADAVAAEGFAVFELPSGAGHDGMAMIDICGRRDDLRPLPRRHQPSSRRARRNIRRRRRRAGAVAADREFPAKSIVGRISEA